jgi:hypothetical protein
LVVGSLPTTTFSLYAGISRVSLSSHKKDWKKNKVWYQNWFFKN